MTFNFNNCECNWRKWSQESIVMYHNMIIKIYFHFHFVVIIVFFFPFFGIHIKLHDFLIIGSQKITNNIFYSFNRKKEYYLCWWEKFFKLVVLKDFFGIMLRCWVFVCMFRWINEYEAKIEKVYWTENVCSFIRSRSTKKVKVQGFSNNNFGAYYRR